MRPKNADVIVYTCHVAPTSKTNSNDPIGESHFEASNNLKGINTQQKRPGQGSPNNRSVPLRFDAWARTCP